MLEANVQVASNADRQDNCIDGVQSNPHECRQVLGQCDALIARLAPHHWLPVEVMQHIFGLSATTFGKVFLPPNKSDLPPQLVLSHVCSAWRHLALGCGALWNDIVISKFNALALDVAEDWLARARNTAVSIKLSLLHCTLTHDLEDVFKSLFCPLRLKHLDLMLSSNHMVQLGNLTAEAFPHIEDIRIVLHGDKHSSPVSPRSFITNAQYLLCASGPCAQLLHSGCFPMNHLRHLDLQCVELTPAQCFSILSQATSLEACRFLWYWECENVESSSEQEFKDVELPNMKVFSLEFHREGRASNVFKFMTRHLMLPNLKKLSIRYRGLTSGTISSLSERFNFSGLEDLELRKTGFMSASDVFMHTHSLRRTTLSKNILIDQRTVDALSSGKFAPLLESIKSNDMCDAKAVFRMIETRWNHARDGGQLPRHAYTQTIAPLRYVDFRTPESLETYGRELETAKKLGVRVVMNNYLNRRKFFQHAGSSDVNDIWNKFVRPLHM